MNDALTLTLDRAAKPSLASQIHIGIRDAIAGGRLREGTRLPSWRDLATQLGVSRGTVRAAYERLVDEHLIVSAGAAGSRVVGSAETSRTSVVGVAHPFPEIYDAFGTSPKPFQNGVPAEDAFPYGVWSRLLVRGARLAAQATVGYPDPRGDPGLRQEIAAYLAVARGLPCNPAQVILTAGFSGALGLILATLGLGRREAWLEDPGFPLTRIALNKAGLKVVSVPVDQDGLRVAEGVDRAPEAALAVVTPGQQAPLGYVMSRERRVDLLRWASHAGAWIVEDDYLGELQMDGRAAPALASMDRAGRVIHAGTFSKTISPALRLGFLVVPPDLVDRFGECAAVLAPAPTGSTVQAVTAFMAEGHYLRHLRRMKRLYADRKRKLVASLNKVGLPSAEIEDQGGFAVRLMLPDRLDDVDIAFRAKSLGLSVVPLSPWYRTTIRKGLLLGFANLEENTLLAICTILSTVIDTASTDVRSSTPVDQRLNATDMHSEGRQPRARGTA